MRGARGTTDYYPEEAAIRGEVFDKLRASAKSFGFVEVSPPIIEQFELLSRKQGDEIRSQIFNLEKKGSEELALRAELTPSFARMFLTKEKSLGKPVKWFTLDRVYRYERPQKGREREFYQYNVECYGTEQASSDAEIIKMAIAGFKTLGVTDDMIEVRVNSRSFMESMLSRFTKDVEAVLLIIDKMLKVSEADFKKMLSEHVKDVKGLMKILKTSDVSKLKDADDLKGLFSLLPDNCVFSASTVRGLAYYTGTVFEVYDKKGKLRALAGGGRYDSLLETYGGRKTPAVGFGLGYTTLRLFLEQQKLLPKISLGADYYVGSVGEDRIAALVSDKLREAGNSVYLNTGKKNAGNQIKDATSRDCKEFILVGSNEVKSLKLNSKNLKSGKNKELTFSDIGLKNF